MSVDSVLAAFREVRPIGQNKWKCLCSAHAESNPSLEITVADDGKILVQCRSHGCKFKDIAAGAGLQQSAFFPTNGRSNGHAPKPKAPGGKVYESFGKARDAINYGICKSVQDRNDGSKAQIGQQWSYKDAYGQIIAYVIRWNILDAESRIIHKEFRPVSHFDDGWRIRDPLGNWPLYRLVELLTAPDGLIFVCEGEKAADAIAELGLIATTSAHGAQSPQKTDWSALAGKFVIIIPDNDPAGETYAHAVKQILLSLPTPAVVKILRLPGLDIGEDAVEFIQRRDEDGKDKAEIIQEIRDLAERLAPEVVDPVILDDQSSSSGIRAERDSKTEPICLTDIGNGKRFAAEHGIVARFCHVWKKWFIWDGRRWAIDTIGMAQRLAKETILRLYSWAKGKIDELKAALKALGEKPDEQNLEGQIARIKEVLDWAHASQSRAKIESMLVMASSEFGIPIEPEELDRDPWVLNCGNGTLDLRTGELRPHDQNDFITKLCPTDYDATATCPTWMKSLRQIFADKELVVSYSQRLAGYWTTGLTTEHILPVLHGDGSNGKGVFINTLFGVMGRDYSGKAPRDLIIAAKGEKHPTSMAWLHGKRMVSVIETADGAKMDEALVKELTGGDPINARRMREDFWEFIPTHKISLVTNHKPTIQGQDYAIWRRLRLVPFTVTFTDETKDIWLPDKLKSEAKGILAWMVAGCKLWQTEGFREPQEVLAATSEYKAEEDVLGTFISDQCKVGSENYTIGATDLWNAFKTWAERANERHYSQKQFGMAMKRRKIEAKKYNGCMWYKGIELRDDSDDSPEETEI